ncbi:MAG: hypothetical protein RLZZ246_895 [Planctomycetota bacterium]
MRCGRSVADPADDPVVVETVGEVAERLVELLDGAVALEPGQLLLQRADESLDAAVALGLPNEGRARLDAEGLELVLECVRGELRAVVVAELRADRDTDEVRTPRSWRSQAQTLRSPSPTKIEDPRTARISPNSASSDMKPLGPRLAGSQAVCDLCLWTVARAMCHARQTRWIPQGLFAEGDIAWLTAMASAAEAVLQDLDILLEELDLRGLAADLGLQVVDEAVAMIGLAGLEPGLHGGEGLVTPLGERAGRDSELAAEGIEGLATKDAEDDLRLASARPAALVGLCALCRGCFMESCIVASFANPVSQETVRRTKGDVTALERSRWSSIIGQPRAVVTGGMLGRKVRSKGPGVSGRVGGSAALRSGPLQTTFALPGKRLKFSTPRRMIA